MGKLGLCGTDYLKFDMMDRSRMKGRSLNEGESTNSANERCTLN